jgi:hypothetical protein
MLSSALKYGTTRHLAPHPVQLVGDFANAGVIPLQWTHGNDERNVLSLMQGVVSRLEVMSPAIMEALRYDIDQRRFVEAKTGKPVSEEQLHDMVDGTWRTVGEHRDAPVGLRTLERGLLFKSLVQRASEEDGKGKSQFADRLLDKLAVLATDAESQTWKIFYSRRPDGRGVAHGRGNEDDVPQTDLEGGVRFEQGDMTFSQSFLGLSEPAYGTISQVELDAVIERVTARLVGAKRDVAQLAGVISAVDAPLDLPVSVLNYALAQDVGFDEIKGVFHDGHIYLVRENISDVIEAEETLLHEAVGHYGARLAHGSFEAMNKFQSAPGV